MKNYLIIISASDMTGYTTTEVYKANNITDIELGNIAEACRYDFSKNNSDCVYLSRGETIVVNLNEINNYSFIKDVNDCLNKYNENKIYNENLEREEYERLKLKYK
jgi:hypothetical protein